MEKRERKAQQKGGGSRLAPEWHSSSRRGGIGRKDRSLWNEQQKTNERNSEGL